MMDRYVKDKVIGRGSYKTVYKAFDKTEGIEVAWNQIHISSEAHLQRLYSQFHLFKSSLKHQNVIRFYNSWIDHQTHTLNIITELFTSGSLRQYRQKHKKVDIKAVKGWARQILTALNYLHTHSPPIIHGNLKCDNIFVNGNHGEVKIGDLGFTAPALYHGPQDYDDVYSFGMCLLEMFTFELPYTECAASQEIYDKVLPRVKPSSLSKVMDSEVRMFIDTCLVPAGQRLSAKELLDHPFLRLDDGNPLPAGLHLIPHATINPSVPLLQDSTAVDRPLQVSFSVVDSDSHPPVITLKESGVSDSNKPCVDVLMHKGNCKFMRLKGELNDNNTVSVDLRIANQQDGADRIYFSFNLDGDESLSLASDLVDSLKPTQPYITHHHVMFIAQLIDLSLVTLLPNWKPSVPINQLQIFKAPLDDISGMLQAQERDASFSLISFSNLFETSRLSDAQPAIDASVQGSDQPTYDPLYCGNEAEVLSNDDFTSHSKSTAQDGGSDMSLVTANSTGGNHCDCSTSPCLSSVSVDMEHKMEIEKVAGFKEEDDEELKRELHQIELQFQQALKNISLKRHESIVAARKSFSKRDSVQ